MHHFSLFLFFFDKISHKTISMQMNRWTLFLNSLQCVDREVLYSWCFSTFFFLNDKKTKKSEILNVNACWKFFQLFDSCSPALLLPLELSSSEFFPSFNLKWKPENDFIESHPLFEQIASTNFDFFEASPLLSVVSESLFECDRFRIRTVDGEEFSLVLFWRQRKYIHRIAWTVFYCFDIHSASAF